VVGEYALDPVFAQPRIRQAAFLLDREFGKMLEQFAGKNPMPLRVGMPLGAYMRTRSHSAAG